MYTEEYERRGFPFRDFLLKLILIIIFVFLLVWLLPKFISPNTVVKNNGNCSGATNGEVCDNSGIKALTSQIFSDNLEKMKEAAINYYTDERLPQEVGQSDTMTLSDMIGKHLITPLIDKNNKAVDVNKSYVKITKMDDEYILKVNIKDSEKEDYILVHLGCYNYCDSYLCEKQGTKAVKASSSEPTANVPIKGSKGGFPVVTPVKPEVKHYCEYYNGKYYGKNGYEVNQTTYKDECVVTPPQPQTYKCTIIDGRYYDSTGIIVSRQEFERQCMPEELHYCVYYNGKYYGKDGKVVTKDEYKTQCQQEDKHYCVYYDGKYYGKDGDVVSEDKFREDCMPSDEHYCVFYNGKYYGKDGDVVDEAEYKKQCMPEEKHYCVYYDGKYYGKDGDVVDADEYKKQCQSPDIEYIYEYKKVTGTKFSAWTDWSSWNKTSCDTKEVNCSDNDVTCLAKTQLYQRKEKIGTWKKPYIKYRDVVKQTGSYQEKACSNYDYVVINKTTYATTTTITHHYSAIDTITRTTRQTVGGWTYNGRAAYSNPPSDSAGRHYKFVGADFSYCNDTCTSLPKYYYDSYSYTGGGMSSVTSTKTAPGESYDTTSTSTTTTTEQTATAKCGSYTYKTIPIYGTVRVSDVVRREEPLYGTVCYMSTKSRNITDHGKIYYKWSSYNNQELISAGYEMTGNKKAKNK